MPFSSKNKSLIIWFLVVLVVFSILSIGSHTVEPIAEKVSYSQILKVLDEVEDRSASASIIIQGTSWKLVVEDKVYLTTAPLTDTIIEDLGKHKNLEIRFLEPKQPSVWLNIFITWLPFLVIFYFVVNYYVPLHFVGI